MIIVLWSLFLGGVTVQVAGRTPALLYFDVIFLGWAGYQILVNRALPDFGDRTMTYAALLCLWLQLLSTFANYDDYPKSFIHMKIFVLAMLVYGFARRFPPSVLNLSAWGAASSVLLIYGYFTIWGQIVSGATAISDVIAEKNLIGNTLGRSNYVASMMILVLPFPVIGVVGSKGWKRLLYVVLFSVTVIGIVVTMSRGAMLAVVLGCLVCLPLFFRSGLRPKHLAAVACIIGIIFIVTPAGLITANADMIAYRAENVDETRVELMTLSWKGLLRIQF
jgi:hypothetical protein